jgi:6-phosphogluconate dehydrogenase
MQLGMIGLGRMGANMVKRLEDAGHQCVGYDLDAKAVEAMTSDGMIGATSLEELIGKLDAPRHVWIMVPAAFVDATIASLVPLLARGDTLIDGGNSWYHDDIKRAAPLAADHGIDYVDVGTSGGVFGLERGYCLMIGGPDDAIERLAPIFDTLAPGVDAAPRTPTLAATRRRPPSGAGCTAGRTAPATS